VHHHPGHVQRQAGQPLAAVPGGWNQDPDRIATQSLDSGLGGSGLAGEQRTLPSHEHGSPQLLRPGELTVARQQDAPDEGAPTTAVHQTADLAGRQVAGCLPVAEHPGLFEYQPVQLGRVV
jgi:hypothetical protein